MQFLKILFWCLIAFVAALFTYGNWSPVTIRLWSGMEALVKLPFLLLVAFLIGFVPMYFYHHAVRWRLRQRVATGERLLADARAAPVPVVSSVAPVVPGVTPAEPAIADLGGGRPA